MFKISLKINLSVHLVYSILHEYEYESYIRMNPFSVNSVVSHAKSHSTPIQMSPLAMKGSSKGRYRTTSTSATTPTTPTSGKIPAPNFGSSPRTSKMSAMSAKSIEYPSLSRVSEEVRPVSHKRTSSTPVYPKTISQSPRVSANQQFKVAQSLDLDAEPTTEPLLVSQSEAFPPNTASSIRNCQVTVVRTPKRTASTKRNDFKQAARMGRRTSSAENLANFAISRSGGLSHKLW